MRSENRRRGTRSTMGFRVVISVVVVGLLIALMSLSGAVAGLRGELAELRKAERPPAAAPVEAPAVGPQVRPEDFETLKEVVLALRGDLTKARASHAGELEEVRLASETEQRRLKERLATLEALVSAQEEGSGEPVPGPGTDVVPPPEDGSEDPTLLPDPPDGAETVEVEPPSPGPLDGQPEAGTTEEPEPSYTEYKIRRGDTISVIARRFKVDMAELLELNEIDDPRRIQIGQVLKIPK